jgi:hypothetical protein
VRRQAAAPGRRVVSVRVLQCGGAWCAEGEREEAAAVWWRVVRGEGAEASHDRAMTTTGAHSAPGDWASCVVGAGAAPSHRRCVCVCPLDTRGEGARGVVARGAKAEGRGRRRNMAAATGGGGALCVALCGGPALACGFFCGPRDTYTVKASDHGAVVLQIAFSRKPTPQRNWTFNLSNTPRPCPNGHPRMFPLKRLI